MKKIVKMWKMNIWFWKESKFYIKPWRFKDYLYAPVAWFKFMKCLLKDLDNMNISYKPTYRIPSALVKKESWHKYI